MKNIIFFLSSTANLNCTNISNLLLQMICVFLNVGFCAKSSHQPAEALPTIPGKENKLQQLFAIHTVIHFHVSLAYTLFCGYLLSNFHLKYTISGEPLTFSIHFKSFFSVFYAPSHSDFNRFSVSYENVVDVIENNLYNRKGKKSCTAKICFSLYSKKTGLLNEKFLQTSINISRCRG